MTSPIPDPPTPEQMLAYPRKGDLLCFDGEGWRVARRDGWHYEVPEAPNKPRGVATWDATEIYFIDGRHF